MESLVKAERFVFSPKMTNVGEEIILLFKMFQVFKPK
jgi:hypothetical protein